MSVMPGFSTNGSFREIMPGAVSLPQLIESGAE